MKLFELMGTIAIAGAASAQKDIDNTNNSASRAGETFKKGITTVAKWGAAIATAAVGATASLVKFATTSAEASDNIDKMSQKIGISREAYQELDFICSQSGTSVDNLQQSMKTLVSAMDGASSGTESNVEMFEKLGISVTNADGSLRSSEEVMWETISALQEMDNETEKARMATELFGRSGTDLMPLLNQESGSIEAMKKQAHELGLVLDNETIDSGVVLSDTMDQMRKAGQALITKVGAKLMPILTKIVDIIIKNMPKVQKIFDDLSPTLESMLDTILPVLLDLVAKIFPVLSNLIVTLLPILVDVVKQAIPPLVMIISSILPVLVDIISQLAPFISELLPILTSIIEAVLPIVVQLLQQILPIVTELLGLLLPIVEKLLPPILALLEPIMALLEPILGLVSKLLEPLANLLDSCLTPLIGILSNLLTNYLNVIMPIIEWYVNILGTVLTGVIEGLTGMIDGCANAFTGAWEGIKKAWNGAGEFFSKIWESIKNAFGSIGTWFHDTFSKAWEKVKDVFSKGGKIFSGIKDGIASVFSTVVNKIIQGINTVISKPFNAIKEMLDKIKNVGIMKLKPFAWIDTSSLSVPQIPMLEKGGVLNKGQVGFLEGNGDEAVVPLSQNTEWIDKVASRISGNLGNNAVISKLDELIKAITSMNIVLDTGAMVGELTPAFDASLGSLYAAKERGMA